MSERKLKAGDRVRLLNDRLGQTGVVTSVEYQEGGKYLTSFGIFTARITIDQTGEKCVGLSEKEGDFSHLLEIILDDAPKGSNEF